MKAELWNKVKPENGTRVKAVWVWDGEKVTHNDILFETEVDGVAIFDCENSHRDRYVIPIYKILFVQNK
jgi:hypothetical protein